MFQGFINQVGQRNATANGLDLGGDMTPYSPRRLPIFMRKGARLGFPLLPLVGRRRGNAECHLSARAIDNAPTPSQVSLNLGTQVLALGVPYTDDQLRPSGQVFRT